MALKSTRRQRRRFDHGWLRPRSRVHADVVERGFWRVRRNVFLSSGQLGWSLGYVILRLAAATPAAAAILA